MTPKSGSKNWDMDMNELSLDALQSPLVHFLARLTLAPISLMGEAG